MWESFVMLYPTAYNNWVLNHPVLNSLINNNASMGKIPAPPPHSIIITEPGDPIITELTSDFMITE